MSTYEFKLPDIGEGVTEGEIVKWLVSPGDVVIEDQPMVEVMTDKATVTITSPKAGKITETRGAVGAIVPVHSVLVVYDLGGASGGASAHAAAPAEKKKDDGPAATAVGDIKEDLPGMSLFAAKPAAAAGTNGHAAHAAPQPSSYFNEKPLATPATRQLARN
ncbi:MAG: 2-oxo acid dehydrogenase subunit E2, partial [Polyangiaceae bacterium]|nr:2-oxo acid dehydrogenase subunit E2 [Polyangiaceae bacterium]